MAVQRRVNWISQQRVDVPDMRAVESASSNDFDGLLQSLITGTNQGYVLRGFEISMAGAIGGASSALQMIVDPGAVLHVNSSQSGTFYLVPGGTVAQPLNSATNTIVDGAFAPSAINYVGIEYERFVDDTTSAQVYLWNPTTNNETSSIAPRAQILRFRIKITTALWASNVLPICAVTTDSGNNVVSVTDCRFNLFRLGQGGATPNPSYIYPWTAQSEGRVENPPTSSSNSVNPFHGGDKMLGRMKDWMDAIMTTLLEIKGTTYWYSPNAAGSIVSLREDLGNTVVTGKGSIAHGVSPVDKKTLTAPGQMNWDQDFYLRVVGTRLAYKFLANPVSTDITLADDYVAYVNLVRGVQVSPNLIFTNGSPTITSVGAISWTSLLLAGDWVKLGSDTDAGYYQILTVDSLTQVTLTENYGGLSTGVSGAVAKYAFGTYQNVPIPSSNRDIFISKRKDVPAGEDVFWLFLRSDNGGSEPRVYIRFLGAELNYGEDRDVSDTTSAELLKYIGSASEANPFPYFVSSLTPGSVPEIINFTCGNAASMSSNQYFYVNSSGNYRRYAVWVNKNGTGVQPNAPYATDYIEWIVTTGQTNIQTATSLMGAFNAHPDKDFIAVQLPIPNAHIVQVTNSSAGATLLANNFSMVSPFAITLIQAGTGDGNFKIIDGDNLTLAIKKLDEALGSLTSILDTPAYDETVDILASGATPPTSLNGPIVATTVINMPPNSRITGSPIQQYTVGNGVLEVFLNGQYLRLGLDWQEVGIAGQRSTQIEILQTLVVGDFLDFRIDTSGGSSTGDEGIGPPGPAGPQGLAGVDAAGGPIAISIKTSNYSVLTGDNFLKADCTSGPLTFQLPSIFALSVPGRLWQFKKIDSSSNPMILMPFIGQTIDGQTSVQTIVQYESFSLITDGTEWSIF